MRATAGRWSAGRVVRDLMLAHVPAVPRIGVHATAALAGSLVMLPGRRFGLPDAASAGIGALACFSLRLLSFWRRWNPPITADH